MSESEVTLPYWRRWAGRAFSDAKAFLGLRLGVVVLAVLGPPLGLALWGIGTDPNKGIGAAGEPVALVLAGVVGELILLAITFVAESLLAPGRMDREATAASLARDRELRERGRLVQSEMAALKAEVETETLRDVEVVFDEEALASVDCSDESRARWLKFVERHYLEPLDDESVRPRFGIAFGGDFESRKPEEFRLEVNVYLDGMKQHWIGALRAGAIWNEVSKLGLAVVNRRDISIEGVEACLLLPGDVGAGWEADAEKDDEIPSKPEHWRASHWLGAIPSMVRIAAPIKTLPGTIERVDGRLRIAWRRDDLGASGRIRLPELCLFIPSSYAGKTLPIEWSLTSRQTRGSVSGAAEIQVRPDPLLVTKAIDWPWS